MSSNLVLYSWNVNGLRAALKKGFVHWVERARPDILCLQETKARPDPIITGYPIVILKAIRGALHKSNFFIINLLPYDCH